MIVRELIDSLRDYDENAIVEVIVESNEESFDSSDFTIEENKCITKTYLTFKVIPDGHVVVDEQKYQDLQEEKLESDELVNQMTATVEEMQQRIYELEEGN